MWLITPLSIDINLRLDDSTANLLASPRIRTKNKEKARILIGDKVPVITNSVTPMATGAAVVTGTVQYIDVGVKLEVEPIVHVEGDVSIKLNLDVSNIVKEFRPAGFAFHRSEPAVRRPSCACATAKRKSSAGSYRKSIARRQPRFLDSGSCRSWDASLRRPRVTS
jgi:type II secretory pathway component GspD/PulD (secretin)